VQVLAPIKCPTADISAFVRAKQNWIVSKLNTQRLTTERQQTLKAKPQMLVRGVLKNIITQTGTVFHIEEEQQSITIVIPSKVNSENIDAYKKKKLALWLQEQANRLFPQRLLALSKQSKLTPTSLVIKQYKARWGSCNSQGVISLNYLLMMTPAFVIDYVIVHELCHLKHMNHSSLFWNLVEKHDPQFRQAKHWLKINAEQLRTFH
jgi:predicted metal-dependent hydrolase